jgi:hypothetical protein
MSGDPSSSSEAHADAGLDAHAVPLEQLDHRAADGARAALRDGPAVAVGSRAERHADGGGQRRAERPEGVSGDAREQGPRLDAAKAACEQRGRHPGPGAEAGELDRVPRQVEHRAHEVGGDVVEAVRERSEEAPPAPPVASRQPLGRLVDRAPGGGAMTADEWMGVLDRRPEPRQAVRREVELVRERRPERERMRGRALVVDQSREGQLAAARPAAEPLGGLEHTHLDALGREGQGGGEPVGTTADHHSGCHEAALAIFTCRKP